MRPYHADTDLRIWGFGFWTTGKVLLPAEERSGLGFRV